MTSGEFVAKLLPADADDLVIVVPNQTARQLGLSEGMSVGVLLQRENGVERLLTLADQVFEGDTMAAWAWFNQANPALGDKKPRDMAATKPGFRMVEELLLKMDTDRGLQTPSRDTDRGLQTPSRVDAVP